MVAVVTIVCEAQGPQGGAQGSSENLRQQPVLPALHCMILSQARHHCMRTMQTTSSCSRVETVAFVCHQSQASLHDRLNNTVLHDYSTTRCSLSEHLYVVLLHDNNTSMSLHISYTIISVHDIHYSSLSVRVVTTLIFYMY